MSFSDFNFYAVIPAAGSGSRMKSGKNKQFLELAGIPVIARTLTVFENSPLISKIVVSARDSEKDELIKICKEFNITKLSGVVSGGETRQMSVRNSLLFLAEKITSRSFDNFDSICDNMLSNSYVFIHDGARPFVSNETIVACADCVVSKKACGAGVLVKDTIKQTTSENEIAKTLDRSNLWAIQTPQAFSLDNILALHNKAYEEKKDFTDDTALCEYYGQKAFMVEGSYNNIKITTPEDLLLGEIILKSKISKQ